MWIEEKVRSVGVFLKVSNCQITNSYGYDRKASLKCVEGKLNSKMFSTMDTAIVKCGVGFQD